MVSAIFLIVMFAYAVGYMVYTQLEDNKASMDWEVLDEYIDDNNRRGL